MFLEERYEKIIEIIKSSGRVKVKDLSELFEVTQDCIRKDLKELESRGHLKRVYGGAIAQRDFNEIKNVDKRKDINIQEKKAIALKAITLIDNGDIIFLDISTNSLEIAKELNKINKEITVVTNMIEIVLELRSNKNIKVICIGGEFNKEIGAIVGSAADRYIRKFTFDKAFIGVCGINLETGYITTLNLEDGNTKKTIIECSNKRYLVMEKEKFNYDGLYKFANLDEVTSIITEDKIINQN